jgi:YebC/PmpR family DNA-binding regulatory protein
MAGHSHSANIARRKNAVDAKRAKIFSKCSRALMSAVRQGGPDPEQNLKLKYAIEAAKADNMPKDNIQRAILSASGDKAGVLEELTYEGFAPGGVALMVSALTDNRARTASDLKHLFDKRGGNLGAPGSVGFLFQFRARFLLDTAERSEDQITELALEVGAEDVQWEAQTSLLLAAPTEFLSVKAALERAGEKLASAALGYQPLNTVAVPTLEDAKRLLRLIDDLEDNDDVQQVFGNYELDPAWDNELSG